MGSAAAAIAWEFRQRHRWGLIALAVYLIGLGTIKLLVLGPSAQPVDLERSRGMWFLVLAPLTAANVYVLTVFTFGLAGDVAARESIYPARLFTLPVTTAALALWPMLYGGVAVAGLWLATALFALRPSGIDVPLVWPALCAAALLAWTQALMWLPYGWRGLRVIVAWLWLSTADIVVALAIHYKPPERLLVAGLLPQLPLAFLAARSAIARARRGDVPEWRGILTWLGRMADSLPSRRVSLPSPARAQAWFEWRRHGLSLPTWVGILLPFELALLFAAGNEAPVLVFIILLAVLFTPPFMAAFTAATVRQSNPFASDSYPMTPFIATRPMTSAALIAAKLKVTIWSTLAAWGLVLVAIPLGLAWSGTWPVVIEHLRDAVARAGTPRAIVAALLGFAGLVALTWKQLVQTLYVGLSGREWVVRTNLFLALSFLCLVGPIAQLIHDDRTVQAALWDALPWVPAVLVGIKMPCAAWVATRLARSGLLPDRTLVTGAAGWCVVVLGLHGTLAWLVSTPHIANYWFALVAILAVPLVRLSAAPLALAWNRHR